MRLEDAGDPRGPRRRWRAPARLVRPRLGGRQQRSLRDHHLVPALHHAAGGQDPELAGRGAAGVLDDPGQVALGAVHYADGCAPCHGAPGEPRSPLMLAMTPPPPWLPRVIPTWDTEALFWIVRHGVKYSGMPAWPAQARADEVWAVVAFLRALPDLDAATYRRLVVGPGAGAADGGSRGDSCRCGGVRQHPGRLRAVPWAGRCGSPRGRCAVDRRAEPNLPGRHAPRLCGGPTGQRHHAAAGSSRAVRAAGQACGPLRAAAVGRRGRPWIRSWRGQSWRIDRAGTVCRREAFRPARVVTARHPDTLTIHASQARTPASSRAS